MPFRKHQTATEGTSAIPEPRALPELLSLLSGPLAEQRQSAIRALVAYPAAALFLCRRLRIEEDAASREALTTTLMRIGGPDVIDGVVPLLRHENASVRQAVSEILAELPQDLFPHIETLLDTPDADMRIAVAATLRGADHAGSEAWALAILKDESDVNVVATALEILNEAGTSNALDMLATVAARFADEPSICFAVDVVRARIQRNMQ
jgi:HEAT repeat protein